MAILCAHKFVIFIILYKNHIIVYFIFLLFFKHIIIKLKYFILQPKNISFYHFIDYVVIVVVI